MLTEGHEQRVGPRNPEARQKRGRPGHHKIFMRESTLVHSHLDAPGGWIATESARKKNAPFAQHLLFYTPDIRNRESKLERCNQKEKDVNFDPLSHIG